MDSEERHYPPGAEPEQPAKEAPQPETPAEEKAPEPEGETPEETKPEEQPEPEGDAPAPEPEVKKRSIYDDLKEKKQQAKEATARAEAAEARAADLQALLDKKDDAKTPEERKEAKDDLEAFAEKEGLKPDALNELIGIISKRLPKPEGGVFTKEEAEEWRAERARAKATAEDQAVLHEATGVRKQLEEFGTVVHDDAEFQAVMAEVVKLSHTKEFHDKPVDYIVYANRDALKKMISPKKPSFEQGGQAGGSGSEGAEFSGKMTPMQAEQAVHDRGRSSSFEIRRST